MKFANVDLFLYNNYIPGNAHYWNFGDQIQLIAIEKLYEMINISLKDIVLIPSGKLSNYSKEKVTLPLNICMQKSKGLDYFWLSPNIFPVFLGINLQTNYLTKTMVDFFKQYQPIGCRDEWTYNILQSYEIESYINGCITAAIFPRRTETGNYDKIFFIDIPDSLKEFIPNEFAENSIETSNNFYGKIEDLVPDLDIRSFVLKKYNILRDSARLVVTSRLHVAAPCASMRIPVILVRNNIPNTFTWINRFVPTYSKNQFPNIDWNPVPVNYDYFKREIISLSIDKIKGIKLSEKKMKNITNFYLAREKNQNTNCDSLFQDFINYINISWTSEIYINYAIWGINDIAESLYYYISEKYPNAKLKKVYDKNLKIIFHGVKSKYPNTITSFDTEFFFICATQAKIEAKEIFVKIGKPNDSFFMPGYIDKNNNMLICE